jgi:hypothetical protein
MTQADSAPEKKTSEKKSSSKKSRNPVERAIVWGLIAIAAVVAVIEFRAKRGYDSSLAYIQQRVDEYNSAGDAEDVPPLKLSEVKQHLSGGPSFGELKKPPVGASTLSLKWLSLFKRYELILVVNKGTDEGIVFNVRPAEPAAD